MGAEAIGEEIEQVAEENDWIKAEWSFTPR